MQTVILFFKRKIVAQAILDKLRAAAQVRASCETDYSRAADAAEQSGASAALIEATEGGDADISGCLALCGRLRGRVPGCKLLLVCPESDPDAVSRAIEVRRAGAIEDFIFYDASVDYMVSKLLSL